MALSTKDSEQHKSETAGALLYRINERVTKLAYARHRLSASEECDVHQCDASPGGGYRAAAYANRKTLQRERPCLEFSRMRFEASIRRVDMRVLPFLCAITLPLLLSACSRPEATITVTIKIPAKSALSKNADSPAVSLFGSFAMGGPDMALDAAAMAIDVSNSTVGFPAGGITTLRLFNGSGVLVKSGSFGWARSGNILYFSSPGAVNAWLQSSGVDPYTSRIDYAFNEFAVAANEEENLVAATVEMSGVPVVSGAASYSRGGGGHCTPRCVIQ